MIFIHIGMEKTGTTSIQHFLYNNPKIMLKNKIYVPQFDSMSLTAMIAKTINEKLYPEAEWVKEFNLKKFTNDIIKKKTINIIISSEHFHSCVRNLGFNKYEKFVKAVKKVFSCFGDAKIIFYLRRPDEYIESCLSERIKADGNINAVKLYHRRDLSNFEILSYWEEMFGKSNCIVRLFDKRFFTNNDLIIDFLTIVGIRRQDLDNVAFPLVNSSLPVPLIYYLSKTRNSFKTDRDYRDFFWPLLPQMKKINPQKYYIFSNEKCSKILAHYYDIYSAIFKKYINTELTVDDFFKLKEKVFYNDLLIDDFINYQNIVIEAYQNKINSN